MPPDPRRKQRWLAPKGPDNHFRTAPPPSVFQLPTLMSLVQPRSTSSDSVSILISQGENSDGSSHVQDLYAAASAASNGVPRYSTGGAQVNRAIWHAWGHLHVAVLQQQTRSFLSVLQSVQHLILKRALQAYMYCNNRFIWPCIFVHCQAFT